MQSVIIEVPEGDEPMDQLRNIENVLKRFESLTDLTCHLFSCTTDRIFKMTR